MSEFREPWSEIELWPAGRIWDRDHTRICECDARDHDPEELATRIVAAVNFCAGLPTDFLERHHIVGDKDVGFGITLKRTRPEETSE